MTLSTLARVVFAALFALVAGPSRAQDAAAPAFSDYPASPRYTGPTADARLSGRSERLFRTRLQSVSAGPVLFAGEYGFGCWGAGTSNLQCAAVSKRTGRVVWLPGLVYHGSYPAPTGREFVPVEVRPDSRLIVLRGMLNEQEPLADHYYELRDGAFRLIRRVLKQARN